MNSRKLNSLMSFARHPAAALGAGTVCAIAAAFLLCGAIGTQDRMAAADDPVAISDRALAQAFDRSIAEREIQAALSAGDIDLAQSFTAFGDLFVFGDIRDAARESTRYLSSRAYDPWILGLAGVGIVITAVTYASLGATLPERG